jgi:hypothetical protein
LAFLKLGLIDIVPPEERIELASEDPIFLTKAKSKIEIIGTSLNSFWKAGNRIVERLEKKGCEGIEVDVYLLNPNSFYTRQKSRDENVNPNDYKNKIKTSIYNFLEKKSDCHIEKMKIWLYDEYPIWHMIICDCEYGKISFYPKGEDAKSRPYYVFKGEKNQTLLEPLCLHLEQLKKRSIECTWRGSWIIHFVGSNSKETINLEEIDGTFSAKYAHGKNKGQIKGSSSIDQSNYFLKGIWQRGVQSTKFEFKMMDDFRFFDGYIENNGQKETCKGCRSLPK